MLDFFEIIRRALNGPYYSEQDFDMKVVVPKLRQVVKKYGIESEDVHYVAKYAYDKLMSLKYYPDAIATAQKFGIVNGVKEPAVMLMGKYLKYGKVDEARELAKKHDLEKEFERLMKSKKVI